MILAEVIRSSKPLSTTINLSSIFLNLLNKYFLILFRNINSLSLDCRFTLFFYSFLLDILDI